MSMSCICNIVKQGVRIRGDQQPKKQGWQSAVVNEYEITPNSLTPSGADPAKKVSIQTFHLEHATL